MVDFSLIGELHGRSRLRASFFSFSGELRSQSHRIPQTVRSPEILIDLDLPSQILTIRLRFSRWGCPPSKFPWTYEANETCFLLKGNVKVYPEGFKEFVEFGAGDLVEFPKGMSCTWDVAEAVDKHYKFD